jgi:hypothetical protein
LIDLSALRQAVADNRYIITQHAQQRMGLRRVLQEEIRFVVSCGDVVEIRPHSQRAPKVLLMVG